MNNELKKDYTSRTERRLIEEELEKTKQIKEKEKEESRQELKQIIFNNKNDTNKTKPKKPHFTNIVLSLTLVLTFVFSLYLIYDSVNRQHQIYQIINAVLILITVISFLVSFKKAYFSKKTKASIFTALCLIILMSFNGLYFLNIIKLPTQKVVPDFSNTTLSEAIKWAESNNIEYEQTYEYSDQTKKYNIISQSVKANKLIKNINKINFEVSNGPDFSKEVIITDMTDWNIDDAVKVIDENFLNNVTINFEENEDVQRDIVFNQSKTGTVKRSDPITLTVSIGLLENLKPISMKNLKNESVFKAILYLNRNNIDYELKYNFSDTVQKGNVIKSSVKKGETISPGDKVILTISKGKKITVPELTNMKMSDVTKWIIENNLKLNYSDKYDNNIKNGHVLEATYKKGDIIEEETIIGITVSKGKLKMPKFKNLSEFKSWAEKYNIKYEIKEEFNSDVPKDEIIKFSVKTGKKINIKEGITVYMSKGKAITVPDFSGKTKDAITKECNSLNITCTFINEYNTGTAEGTCISQNIKFGQEISQGDNIQITIATKKQEEVTKTNASKSTKTNNYNSSQKNNYNNNLNNNETSDEKKCNSITIRILPNYVALNDPDKTCKNIKEKYNNAICKMTESNSGTKGQILNTSSLQGKTITDCENFTVEIKSN